MYILSQDIHGFCLYIKSYDVMSFCPFIRKLCQLSTMTKKHKTIYGRLSAIKLFKAI